MVRNTVIKLASVVITVIGLLTYFGRLTVWAAPVRPIFSPRVFSPSECVTAPSDSSVSSLSCLADIVARVILYALMFIGGVVLIYFLYGCLLFILSRGDSKALEKAKRTITFALLGGLFVVGSFLIVNAVSTLLGLPYFLDFTLFQKGP